MQFSSSARPATMSYPENIHEPNSNSKRLFGSISIVAGNSKGLENNISGVSNNISGNHIGDSNNNIRNSNLGQVNNIFRPDPHEEPSPTTAPMATAATATTDNTITMQKDNDKVTLTASGATAAKYKECLKNHAANMGGYAVDGCGEFMPSGEEGSLEALKCAACGCHRNFHRREMNGASSAATGLGLLALPSPVSASNNNVEYGEGDHHSVPGGGGGHHSIMGFSPAHLHHHHHHQYIPHAMSIGGKPAIVGGGGGHHQHQHHGMLNQYGGGMMGSAHHQQYQYYHGGIGGSSAGKRFRTKFTMEQREKMYEFSEKVGWRIQKQDEAAVQQFCAEVGVKRHVLKVWMHNNKNTFRKKLLRFPEAFNPTPAEPSSSQ